MTRILAVDVGFGKPFAGTKTTLKTAWFDMNNAEFFADPYPTYARLRASAGPTYSEAEQTWLVTR